MGIIIHCMCLSKKVFKMFRIRQLLMQIGKQLKMHAVNQKQLHRYKLN